MIRKFHIAALLYLSVSAGYAQNAPTQLPVGQVNPNDPTMQGAPSAPAPATGHPQMTPEEIRAAENLNAQVAQQYAQAAQAGAPIATPPAAAKRTGIKPPPETISIKPGVNAVFGIAQGHLNRLVTPFRNPVVKTTAVAATSIEKNIVYVSTNNAEPVGFYIHDVSDPLDAISVTMVPSDIPPISVTLNLVGYTEAKDGSVTTIAGDPKLAKGWETGSPFVETLKNTFRSLAKGMIPDGYSFEIVQGWTKTMPRCTTSGLRIEPKQLLQGYNMQVVVARVTNLSDSSIDINENTCNDDAVVAVAAWPVYAIPPRGATELYVAVRKIEEPNADQVRPSLVEGAL